MDGRWWRSALGFFPPAPVIGIALTPTFLRLALVGPIVGIGGHFGPLPPALPLPLAGLPAAEPLILDPGIGRYLPTTT